MVIVEELSDTKQNIKWSFCFVDFCNFVENSLNIAFYITSE